MIYVRYSSGLFTKRITFLLFIFLFLFPLFGCRTPVYVPRECDVVPFEEEGIEHTAEIKTPPPPEEKAIPQMGHSIQVGAFSVFKNAVDLSDSLQELGLEPYYFKDDSGLYKVRFGNFASMVLAQARAKELCSKGTIKDFYLVGPQDYKDSEESSPDEIIALRKEIVRTAKKFIGVPYRFGGENAKDGFDCSGLTMASYRLNGLKLPRNSRMQWKAGKPVDKKDAMEADLVFFDTMGKGRVTHVGMYIGNGKFIHAPKTGKTIRIESMSNSWFKKRYLGTRSYL